MLPSLTLHSAMKVATIATLTATSPLRFEPAPSPDGPPFDFSIASLTESERSLMAAMLPRKTGPVFRRRYCIAVISILLLTRSNGRRHAGRFLAAGDLAELMHHGGAAPRRGSPMTLTGFMSFLTEHPL